MCRIASIIIDGSTSDVDIMSRRDAMNQGIEHALSFSFTRNDPTLTMSSEPDISAAPMMADGDYGFAWMPVANVKDENHDGENKSIKAQGVRL